MMDPTEALRLLLNYVDNMLHDPDEFDPEELAERVAALDNWLKGGGFLPEQWRKAEGGMHYRIEAAVELLAHLEELELPHTAIEAMHKLLECVLKGTELSLSSLTAAQLQGLRYVRQKRPDNHRYWKHVKVSQL